MADIPIEVLPQPRIDTLVTDAVTGVQRRRTEDTGTAWSGGRPQVTGYGAVTRAQPSVVVRPFFLPDSLPDRPDPLNDAQVACSVAIQGSEDGYHQVVDYRGARSRTRATPPSAGSSSRSWRAHGPRSRSAIA